MKLAEQSIIIVEDDEFLRQMIRDLLISEGAREENIRSFADGAEALDYFQEEPDKRAIVVSDIAMPRVSGIDLYKRVRSLAPQLKFIFITALQLTLAEQRLLKEEGLPVLSKPLQPARLIEAIEKASD